jgi:3-hydroxymyristoyl/3-hydroxydecanoyl-(acyl carrier protein) dehydratase/NAD(P)-dependent dehydrogenase (short-subunit alcohol dehydrogenase family)
MLNGKDILIIGAREGGYGASIARAAVNAGARVFATTLIPEDPREQSFFRDLGTTLLDVPLRFDMERHQQLEEALDRITGRLKEHGVTRLDAVIHTVAGGFPRQPAVMKAVGDILKGKCTFADMATAVKRNVYYVNAGSFDDTVNGFSQLTDDRTHLIALTYRGDLPYFIADTKAYLERLTARLARQGNRTLAAALPEAWTQSSQFFTGIEIAVMHNYLKHLRGLQQVSDDLAPAFAALRDSLAQIEGLGGLIDELERFINDRWREVGPSSHSGDVYRIVQELFGRLRNEGKFGILRRAVELISTFVRDAAGHLLVREFLVHGRYDPGDVRQIRYSDLGGATLIGPAAPRPAKRPSSVSVRKWVVYEKDEIRRTLNMYGDNFLFLDRVVMEDAELHDGGMGFGCFTVPSPAENPIMKDHFVGMPLFGGHLQMEAVAQFGTFMILKCLEDKNLIPILTGTEFPNLNTMAPPGEKLSMMGIIHLEQKRGLTLEAFIENRYARSRGVVRGMILSQRILRKMTASFYERDSDDT